MLEFPVEVTETGRQALRCAHRFAASGLDRPVGPSRMGFHVQCKSLGPPAKIRSDTVRWVTSKLSHMLSPVFRRAGAPPHPPKLLWCKCLDPTRAAIVVHFSPRTAAT